MKTILFLFTFILSSQALAVNFQEPDKKLHAGVSYGLTMGSYGILRSGGVKEPVMLSMLKAAAFSMSVGLAKEMTDPRFDREDLEADAIGTGAGLLIPVSIQF